MIQRHVLLESSNIEFLRHATDLVLLPFVAYDTCFTIVLVAAIDVAVSRRTTMKGNLSGIGGCRNHYRITMVSFFHLFRCSYARMRRKKREGIKVWFLLLQGMQRRASIYRSLDLCSFNTKCQRSFPAKKEFMVVSAFVWSCISIWRRSMYCVRYSVVVGNTSI